MLLPQSALGAEGLPATVLAEEPGNRYVGFFVIGPGLDSAASGVFLGDFVLLVESHCFYFLGADILSLTNWERGINLE